MLFRKWTLYGKSQRAKYQYQYVADEKLHKTQVYRKHRYFASIMVCFNRNSTNYNRLDSYCQMMQQHEWHFQNGLCRNSKKTHNGCLVSCGQTRLIFHCMVWLTRTTVESGQKRTHMHTQRNPYTYHMLLFCVVLPRKLMWVPFSLKSLVQD